MVLSVQVLAICFLFTNTPKFAAAILTFWFLILLCSALVPVSYTTEETVSLFFFTSITNEGSLPGTRVWFILFISYFNSHFFGPASHCNPICNEVA